VLAKLDPGNPATVTALRTELQRHDLRSTDFVLALQAAEHPVDPEVLATCAASEEVLTRLRAINVLGTMGERAEAALDEVGARLHDPHAEVRFAATLALLQIAGSFDPELWKEVVDAALGDVVGLRHPARVTLSKGASVRPAVRELVSARLSSGSPLQRGLAALALLDSDVSDATALRALVKACADSGGEVYWLIRDGALAPCFHASGPAEQQQLLECLSALGPDARRELPWLRAARGGAAPELARRIEKTIACIRGLDSP
jgi:hypothetical protein